MGINPLSGEFNSFAFSITRARLTFVSTVLDSAALGLSFEDNKLKRFHPYIFEAGMA
jgi:hypothetical protein